MHLVRAAYAAFNRRDLPAFLALLNSDVEIDMSERVFNPDTYVGHDEVRRLWSEIDDVWRSYQWEPEELLHTGDGQVLALVRARGCGRGSGVEIDRPIAFRWTLSDGKAVGVRLFADRAEAAASGSND